MTAPLYRERQWLGIEPPPDVFAAPSMLSRDERRLLFSIARDSFGGAGAIIDAGSFLGGSTLAFGRGLQANPRTKGRGVVHSYDMFLLDGYMIQLYVDPARDGPREPGGRCRDLFEHNVASIASLVEVHDGDIRRLGWNGGPIEVLFLDIIKSPETNDTILRDFLPSLLPGRSVVIQQDYVHESHFWIHITMEYLREYFTFIEFVEYSSTVYLLQKAIPRAVLDGCRWDVLSSDDKLRLMDRAISRWQGYPKGVLECSRASMLAYLGDRDGALAELDRIRDDYEWSLHVLTRAKWNRELLLGVPDPWLRTQVQPAGTPPEDLEPAGVGEDLDALRTERDELMRERERCHAELRDLAAELEAIRASATFRLRDRVLRSPVLRPPTTLLARLAKGRLYR